jgi:NAD(P)-dependent dehydrogenase (short-subunit alcohol dehydrogenase family)
MSNTLDGRFAVVTGGSSGIGLASAALFAEEGAIVGVVGRDRAKLAAATARIGEGALGFAADLGSEAGCKRLAGQIRSRVPREVDVLFVNAGASNAPDTLETDEAAFDRVIDTNLKSAFFTVTACHPILARGASVILTSSVGHHRGFVGDPLYNAAKAGVRALGRGFAAHPEFLGRQIRVNTLSFGAVATPMTGSGGVPQAALTAWAEHNIPMRRWADATEAASAALFLAGPGSSYITGAELPVDGGLAQL